MADLITNVQPPLEFIPPDFNPGVLRFCKLGVPWVMRFTTPITEIKTDNIERLVELYQQFQQGKVRLMLAFRHPNTDDPFAMSQLIWRHLPKAAKRQRIDLNSPVHSHFMYDRGIPIWAGKYVTWLFPKLGGTSILRGKLDRQGLKSARDLFANGQFPISASPEGATNGHNQRVSPLEPGIAQLGFWCAEDLQKANRTEEVLIVPIGIQYHYLQENWDAIAQLLTQMESDCGLSILPQDSRPQFSSLYPRLIRLGNYLLDLMENFYRKFYHQNILTDETQDLSTRLNRLLDIALQVSEEYFAIKPKGGLTDRCRRLEQAGWDYIYREDLPNVDALSPVERGLANRLAEEASLRMWHMRLVESFVVVSGQYVQEKPSFERFAETTLIVWKMIARLTDNSSIRRPNLGQQWVQMTVGETLSVSQRWGEYKTSRRQAVEDLTHALQLELEKMIKA